MQAISLTELCNRHQGKVSDKWALYLHEYDQSFNKYRDRELSLLEIGIQNGGSLEIFAQYFHKAKTLIGCDIDEKCADLVYDDPRVSVVCGDAGDAPTVEEIRNISPSFDIVIDDGSHKSSDIIKCFMRYFCMIKDGGIYVVEDLHCSYWRNWEGGLYDPYSSMAFFKRLVDIINYEHWGVSKIKTDPLLGILKKYNIGLDLTLFEHIHSIKFINSMCFIQKQAAGMNELGARVVTGKSYLVNSVITGLNETFNHAPNQIENTWSIFSIPPEEMTPGLLEAVSGLNKDIIQHENTILTLNQHIEASDQQIQTLKSNILDEQQEHAVLTADLARTREQLAQAQGQIEQTQDQFERTQDQLEHAQSQLASTQGQLAHTQDQHNHTQYLLGQTQRQLEQTQDQLTQTQGQFEQMQNQSLQTQDRLEHTQNQLAQTQGQLERTQDLLRQVQGQLMQAQGQIETLIRSMSWRATVPLRAIGARLPTPLRRQLRRALKAAWWAVTPWKMPARLRFLRHRKAAAQPVAIIVPPMPDARATAAPPSGPAALLPPVPTDKGDPVIAFIPPDNDSSSGNVGHYALTCGVRRYTYIPPRPPEDLEQEIAAMENRPQFSIVVPVYNTPPNLLNKFVESVLAQWYPYWELILVNDNSSLEYVRADLNKLIDPRIVIKHLDENKGISGATNEGMACATGDYIVFADHDDELTADCLYELARCIDRKNPDYIYSDEDKITEDGKFSEPHFKPDWSPDTMMSTMYTCHVSCVRRELINEVGGLRSEYDGSQDWDLVLRVTERTNRIAHIPKVLYHWRIIPASVASDLMAKPFAVSASKRVREDALVRRGLDGFLEPVENLPGYFRTVYRPRGEPGISIIIPSKNNHEILKQCIDSIRSKTIYQNFNIIVIDNGSTKPATISYINHLRGKERIKVLSYDKPFNFSALSNLGAAQSDSELLLFLNDDTEILTPDWLERLGGYAQLPHVGAVGAKLVYPDCQRVQHVGVVNLINGPSHAFLGNDADAPGYFARALLEYDWLAVTGACLMIERAKFDQVGRFDENLPVAYNDVDLCFRTVELGFYNLVSPGVKLIHHESYSRGIDHEDPVKQVRLRRDRETLYLKHPQFYAHDPFHNPNLGPNDPWFQ